MMAITPVAAGVASGARRAPAGGQGAPRVGVLDTDSGFVHVLGRRLAASGMPHRVLAGPAPVEELVAMRFGAVVVDPATLGAGAWEWLERLCSEMPALGVLVCSAPSSVAQRVRALRLGVDDWVTKPCHPEEVVARLEAIMRRGRRAARAAGEAEPLVFGGLEIRPELFQAYAAGSSLDLTRREFELILLLAEAEGRVLEREEIYRRIWGYEMARGDRSVDVFVRRLRRKLEQASPGWRYIHTHFGVGYRFAAEAAEQAGPAA